MRLSWEQTYRWNPETLCWDCCWFSLQTLHLSTNTPFIFNCIYFQTCVGSITPPPLLLPISPLLPLTQKQTQIWMLWPAGYFTSSPVCLVNGSTFLTRQVAPPPTCTPTTLCHPPRVTWHHQALFEAFLCFSSLCCYIEAFSVSIFSFDGLGDDLHSETSLTQI